MNKKFLYLFGGIAITSLAFLIYTHKKEIASLLKEIGIKLIERKKSGDKTVDSFIDLFLDLSYKWLTYEKLETQTKETEENLAALKKELEDIRKSLKVD